jgi:hypothetical protein
MTDTPGWIQVLYKGLNAGHALHTAFLHNLTQSQIAEMADGQPNGRRELRDTALSQASSSDPRIVALSLVFLSVVGEAEDSALAAALSDHASGLVRRAARACRFALEHRSRA